MFLFILTIRMLIFVILLANLFIATCYKIFNIR